LSKRKICKIINNLFNKKTTYDHLFRIAINSNILSLSLRTRSKPQKKFFASIALYQRPDYRYKNLNYRKILNYISTINTASKEILLVKKNYLLEGCTTNLLFIKKNKIYIPKEGYYPGITLKFFLKKIKNFVVRKNIHINQLKDFEEIILLGTGKGVVSLSEIKDLNWKRKRNIYYKKLLNFYNKSL
jgi:branched-subunit amino acid aminotransferase/4-amino-4-deoxychorismate lyase